MLVPASFQVEAAIYHLDIGSGSTGGLNPSVQATFEDVSPGIVSFTLSAVDLGSGGKLTRLFLNLDPNLNPKSLIFSPIETSGDFALPLIKKGENKFRGGRTGRYDLLFKFSRRGPLAFTEGDSITYQVAGVSDLLASSFISLSTPNRRNDPSYAAGQLQWPRGSRPGQERTGGIFGEMNFMTIPPVPEPNSLALVLLAGALGLGNRLRSRHRD